MVKNVTGYDLCKLLAGSWGTLAVMTEVTLKVMPRPESERTLMLRGLDDVTANRAMTAALGSPFDVSGAAHLPNSAFRAAAGALGGLGAAGQAVTLLRLEGIAASVAASRGFARQGCWRRSARRRCWRTPPRRRSGVAVRDVQPFAAGGALGAWPVWRIVCPPASGGALGEALARDTGGDVIYDWGGGLIWAALPPKPDAQAALVRAARRCRRRPRHADPRLRRGAGAMSMCFIRSRAALPRLSERVRHSFDPKNILNRGRMTRGSAT